MTDKSPLEKNLDRVLAPRHVAFIGGRYASGALERCRRFGFEGPLWHVNPQAQAAAGGAAFASVEELPEAPDAAYLAVSTDKTIDAVRALARRGAGGCICYAAGFAEKGGDGAARQAELVDAAGDMALIGPNCYGLLEYRRKLHLWTGDVQQPCAGPGIGLISQSGALAEFMTMHKRSVPFVCVVSVGNQAVITLEHVLSAMLDDDGINAIGLYIEGLLDVAWFSRLATKALHKRVALVAIKVGRSKTGAQIARGHTSSLVGTAELYDALFERLGVVQAHSLSEFLETLKLLSIVGPVPGRRVASITASGGQAAMLADRASLYGITYPPLTDAQTSALRKGLPDYVNPMNPLDMTVGPMGIIEQQALIFDTIASGDFDVVTVALDSYDDDDAPFSGEVRMMLEQMSIALSRHAKAGIAGSALSETLPEHIRKRAISAGIAPVQGSEEMLQAIDGAAFYGERLNSSSRLDPRYLELPAVPALGDAVDILHEADAKAELSAAGLHVPVSRFVGAGGVLEAARQIGFPVVLKAIDAELVHKTDAGAVAVGLRDEAALGTALQRMQCELGLSPSGFLVEQMVENVVAELIVGVTFDPAFGQALMIGAGGVLVELIGDSRAVLLPACTEQIEHALDELAVTRVIEGVRGRPAGDRRAVIETIERLCEFAGQRRERLVELDVNPLLIGERGKGAIVADATIRYAGTRQ